LLRQEEKKFLERGVIVVMAFTCSLKGHHDQGLLREISDYHLAVQLNQYKPNKACADGTQNL
jgi:hypothetical protein